MIAALPCNCFCPSKASANGVEESARALNRRGSMQVARTNAEVGQLVSVPCENMGVQFRSEFQRHMDQLHSLRQGGNSRRGEQWGEVSDTCVMFTKGTARLGI